MGSFASLRMTTLFCGSEGVEVDFQVNGETYFVSLAEDEQRWLVFVEGLTGPRRVPVYVDEAEFLDAQLVIDDKKRRHILN